MSVHRIIQDTARLRMDEETTRAIFSDIATLVYHSWPFSEFDYSTERWRQCEPIVPHANKLCHVYKTTVELRNENECRPDFARLTMDLGWYYFERGNLDEARPLYELSQELCDKDPTKCITTMGDISGCLTQIALIDHEPELALSLSKTTIKIFEEHDPHGWRLPQAYNDIGESYIALGFFEESVVYCDRAIVGYQNVSEPEYADWAQMNKGIALCNLIRYEEASTVLEEYLAYREATFGPMDTESLKYDEVQCTFRAITNLWKGLAKDYNSMAMSKDVKESTRGA
ncbi:MAG: hypothetical protein Q9207_006202 [Kuettlingeria erythrocarpa]